MDEDLQCKLYVRVRHWDLFPLWLTWPYFIDFEGVVVSNQLYKLPVRKSL
jgi:hypothetical protein